MSFLFGKKDKKQNAPSQRPGDAHPSPSSGASESPANGVRGKDRGRGVISPPPGASVNNSANSIDDAATPSPEHVQGQRGRVDSDLQHAPRPMQTGPPPGVRSADLYPWSQRRLTFTSAQPNPFPRYGAAVNAVSSKEGDVYLMGGLVNGSTVKGDLWMIEAGGSNLACYPVGTTFEGPGPRVGHASLLVGNAFIVFGGDTKQDERDKLDDTLYLLNTSTRHWSRSSPPGPRPAGRYGHTLNILGSKIYVFGGQVEGYFFNDLIAFDLNALQNSNSRWDMLLQNSNDGGLPEGHIPPARTNHTIVSWNDKLYLFGGTNGTTWFNDVWSYDPKQIAWTQLDCIGYIPAPREGHSAALVGDVMYIFGGRTEQGEDLGDLAAFRITSRRWYTFQNMGPSPSPRSGHSMTAFGKQIVVLAGEPSSAPRDASELSLVYVLNTDKIRYPNDQQIQQTPSGERVPGNRRPSLERVMPPQNRGYVSPNNAPDGLNRKFSGSRESIAGGARPGGPGLGPGPGPAGRGQDINASAPGSRLPRASMAQAPSGPPPQQQAPPPRPNGAIPPSNGPVGAGMNGPRTRTPTRENRGYGPPIDTGRRGSFEKDNSTPPIVSPVGREGPRQGPGSRAMSPVVNGRRTPTQQPLQAQVQQGLQQPSRFANQYGDEEESPQKPEPASRSRSRQANQEPLDEISQFPTAGPQQQRSPKNQYDNPYDSSPRNAQLQREEATVPLQQLEQLTNSHQGLQNQHRGLQNQHEGLQSEYEGLRNQHQGLQSELQGLQSQHQGLQSEHQGLRSEQQDLAKELEAAKSRNAWYASELALARKAGYQPNASQSPILDEKAAQSFGDEDKPLIEALIAMRSQLAEVQGALEAREDSAAQEVAEVEAQRDTAIREAAYAKAKLAAHGGSRIGTPQSENMSRDMGNEDRLNDLGRKLAAALAAQQELRSTVNAMTNELTTEKRAREMAEGTAEAANRRAAEFDQARNPGELETLRTELHQTGKSAREEAALKSEALSRAQLLEVDKEDLERQLAEALENTKQHSITFASLREAVTASTDKTTMLERKLSEERRQRELLDQKLLQLRSEHEERTAELDDTTRKLRDAEDMASSHAAEAQTHRSAVAAGLEKLSTRGVNDQRTPTEDERVPILKQQLESAHSLVRDNQAAANDAAEKLRRAEERIAGLEAYQEQTSRESLAVRKQLNDNIRESQELQARHTAVQRQLETHQRDASALSVQHHTLKELLNERGISENGRSRNVDSPRSGLSTPDNSRVKELEQQLETSQQAHQETKSLLESQGLEADRMYRHKLEMLENDYNSAVSYVKGTEKMLKRMKDELDKYKKTCERLQNELSTAKRSDTEKSMEPAAAEEWEKERQSLHREIEEIQKSVRESHSHLESQLSQVQSELQAAHQERDRYRTHNEQVQQQLAQHTQQTRAELDQLKKENSMLENRAIDAEGKVTLLLDQVGTSVGNYRRQSQQMNGHSHNRNLSNISTTSTSNPHPLNFRPTGGHTHTNSSSTTADPNALHRTTSNNSSTADTADHDRNSLALDHLASELETLRSHWADTHRTYRLSNQFDFERETTPTSATSGGTMSEGLTSWRRRLDEREGGGGKDGGGDGVGVGVRGMPGGLAGSESESEGEGEGEGEEREGKKGGKGGERERGSKSYVI
ncbi:Negative regulator of mitotic exit [Lecanora helva]